MGTQKVPQGLDQLYRKDLPITELYRVIFQNVLIKYLKHNNGKNKTLQLIRKCLTAGYIDR